MGLQKYNFRHRNKNGKTRSNFVSSGFDDQYKIRLREDLNTTEFVVFDIETTGGNPEKNGITEISALKFRGHQSIDSFYSLVNPLIPIPPIVRRMTGIDNKMLRDAPLIEDVIPKFLEFIGSSVLVSHNAIGDMLYLRHYTKKVTKKELGNYFLCTHLLVERLAADAPNKSLKGLAKFFSIPAGKLHRAEADAHLTLALFKILQQKLTDLKIKTVEEAVRFQGDFDSAVRIGWSLSPQHINKLPAQTGVFELFDKDNKLLYAGAAQNLQREVRKLQQIDQTPKALLKRILLANSMKTKVFALFWDALQYEAQVCGKLPVSYLKLPTHHQRSFLALELRQVANQATYEFFFGTPQPDSIEILGPIHDKREGLRLLQELSIAFDVALTPKSVLVLEKNQAQILLDFLRGHLKSKNTGASQSWLNSLLKFVNPFSGNKIKEVDWTKFRRIKLPNFSCALLEQSGILVLNSKQEVDRVFVIDVLNGVEVARKTVSSAQLKIEEELERLKRQVKSTKQKLKILGSVENALKKSAFLHWLYLRKGNDEGKFYRLGVGMSGDSLARSARE